MTTPPATLVYRLIAKDGKAIALVSAVATSRTYPPQGATMTQYATEAEAQAAITALQLIPYITPRQKLTAILGTLSAADQASYQSLFAPITALVEAGKFPEAATALQALALPDKLTPVRAQMLAALHA